MPQPRSRPKSAPRRESEPSFLLMIGIVALCVAVVILVFFGLGYLLGRAFL
jgi:uncharacterized membrane protein YdbT with pleckstrin-like domain